MLYNYLAIISYIGFNYDGWQKQKGNSNTIQEIVTSSLEKLLGVSIKKSSYTGRTDKGVSALFQHLNFFIEKKLDDRLLSELRNEVNKILPHDILVLHITRVDNTFSSRYNVKYKTYVYKMIFCNNQFLVNDVYGLHNYHSMKLIPKSEIIPKVEEFISLFCGLKDYSSYYKPEKGVNKNTMIDLYSHYYVYDFPDFWVLTLEFKAVYFLRNMVRKIVGMLIAFLEGKVGIDYIRDSLENPLPSKGKFIAPPEPLVLYNVKYDRWP